MVGGRGRCVGIKVGKGELRLGFRRREVQAAARCGGRARWVLAQACTGDPFNGLCHRARALRSAHRPCRSALIHLSLDVAAIKLIYSKAGALTSIQRRSFRLSRLSISMRLFVLGLSVSRPSTSTTCYTQLAVHRCLDTPSPSNL